ncbi:MAG: hypothetical protein IT318_07140 [Anaerolineales bacterium]|nr:hypothetical protein [Anaerolineales bacterium]
MSFSRLAYAGWLNCHRPSVGHLDVVVTTDAGPRIICCGLAGGPNLFAEFADELGLTGGDEWRL